MKNIKHRIVSLSSVICLLFTLLDKKNSRLIEINVSGTWNTIFGLIVSEGILNRPRNHLVLITRKKKEDQAKDRGGRRREKESLSGKTKGGKGEGREIEEKYEGSSPCMAASSTDRLPPAGCTIAIVSTFFAPPPAYLSTPRILHLQGGVTLKTLPVLDYPVPLSPSFPLSPSHSFFPPCPSLYPSYTSTILSALSIGLSSSKSA